jgi:hypothetical protein
MIGTVRRSLLLSTLTDLNRRVQNTQWSAEGLLLICFIGMGLVMVLAAVIIGGLT